MRSKLQGVLLLLVLASTTEAFETRRYYDFDETSTLLGFLDSVSGQYFKPTLTTEEIVPGIIGNGRRIIGDWGFPVASNVSVWVRNDTFALRFNNKIWISISGSGWKLNGASTSITLSRTDRQWHNFIGIKDGSLFRLYHNGNLIYSEPYQIFRIIRGASTWVAVIDEMMISDESFSPEEILFLADVNRPGDVYQNAYRPIEFYVNQVLMGTFQTSEQFKGYFIDYAFPPGVSWESVVVNFDNFSLGGTNEFGTVSEVPIEFQNFVLVVLGIFAGFTLAKILTDNLFPK